MKVGIVDAYSTGNQICHRLSKKGVDSFHIQSLDPIPNLLKKSFCNQDFNLNLKFHNNWNQLINNVIEQSPTHIIAGSETGVLLADKLAHALSLPSNIFNLSEARRNKYLMLNVIKNAGLNAVWQLIEHDLDELLAKLIPDCFPVVIKPVSSSSGDGFHICHNHSDVRIAFNKIIGKKNILDEDNYTVLCQSFLEGIEYVINSVSYKGIHYITDIWEMQHRHTTEIPMIIDSMTLISPMHKSWKVLIKYIKNVLTTLGICFGSAHTEVMLTKKGPFLIEVNSRLMGGNIDSCFREALNDYDQIDALVDSLVAPNELKAHLTNGYSLKYCLAEVNFIFYKTGILRNFTREQEIRCLHTFKKFSKLPEIGSYVKKTSNTTNVEGLLYLMHADYKKVITDRDKVVTWQKDNLIFQIDD